MARLLLQRLSCDSTHNAVKLLEQYEHFHGKSLKFA